MQSLYESFENLHENEHKKNLKKHLDSNRALLLSLVSAESKKTVEFKSSIEPEFYARKFLIS